MRSILHIIDSMGIGGAEKLVNTVIKDLHGHYDQHLILLNQPETLLADLRDVCKIEILDFTNYRDLIRTRKRVRRYIRDNQIDLVHSQLYWSNVVARISTPRSIPVFNSIQAISSEGSYKVNRLSLYLEKLTYSKRHFIIGVSDTVLKDFDEWVGLKGESAVLYNVIDDSFFVEESKRNFNRNAIRMVAVGNLRWQKNYPYLLRAFENMPENVSLDVYGEGDLRNEFQEQIDSHGLNIRLCGHRNDMPAVLREYDIFVMSSLYEGFSLGLMEAMASGLPALLSDVPVLREAGGEHAVYFDLNNTLDLVDKTKRFLDNPSLLYEFSERSRERAAIARKRNHVSKLMNLYNSHPVNS